MPNAAMICLQSFPVATAHSILLTFMDASNLVMFNHTLVLRQRASHVATDRTQGTVPFRWEL